MKTPGTLAREVLEIIVLEADPEEVNQAAALLTAWRDEVVKGYQDELDRQIQEIAKAIEERDAAVESCRMMQDRLQRLIDAKEAKE